MNTRVQARALRLAMLAPSGELGAKRAGTAVKAGLKHYDVT
jgi:hypothetical protein